MFFHIGSISLQLERSQHRFAVIRVGYGKVTGTTMGAAHGPAELTLPRPFHAKVANALRALKGRRQGPRDVPETTYGERRSQ